MSLHLLVTFGGSTLNELSSGKMELCTLEGKGFKFYAKGEGKGSRFNIKSKGIGLTQKVQVKVSDLTDKGFNANGIRFKAKAKDVKFDKNF